MEDTICAIATPPGSGGVGIARVSGPRVPALTQKLLGRLPAPRVATYVTLIDETGQIIDQGLSLYFPAPASYTGEHVLELQLHGSPLVLDQTIRLLVAAGARLARPGEFTERAFLNGKLDLVQAEAVADLIGSTTQAAARAAAQSLTGTFSATVDDLLQRLIRIRVDLEAGLDFAAEDISPAADTQLLRDLAALETDVAALVSRAREGRLLRDGATIVLLGRPNAGKSTLFNALCGHATAIVSPVPGTTRDLLRETIDLGGIPVTLVDTAGLRESHDPVEREGVARAQAIAQAADLKLALIDDTADDAADTGLPDADVLRVYTKIDASGRASGATPDGVAVSAHSGAGLDALQETIATRLRGTAPGEGTFSARRRHIEALREVATHVPAARLRQEENAHDLAAEDLRRAQEAIGVLTGTFTSDALLGEIFGTFCIGK